MEHSISQFGAIIPKKITQSYLNFGNEIQHSEFLILMFDIGGEYIVDNKESVRQSLIRLYDDPENETSKKLISHLNSNESDKIFDIKTYEQFYGQMCYARTIDNVLTYFKDILGEVILKTPEILKSKESERLDFILKFDSIQELRIALSERKIEALFYAGIDKIEMFFLDRLGIKLFKTSEDKKEFNQAVKNRNIIVHNRGRIKNISKNFLIAN